MTKQNVFIINFNSLYEILDEIKENLFFKIIKCENEADFIKVSNPNIINSLIIVKPNYNSLLNKDINDTNFFKSNKPLGVELSPSFLLEFIPVEPIEHLNLKSSIKRVFLFLT